MFSVIVPTYNECSNILELIQRALAAFDRLQEPAELLIVDDDSPDGTARVAREAAFRLKAGERVKVIIRTHDKGLAKAVNEGFRQAKGDVFAVMDADLSHPPELLPKLLAVIRQGADAAIASRYVEGGGTADWPLARRIISRGACLLARPLTSVKDATSGFFALRRESLQAIHYQPRGYKIGLELFARLHDQNITEVPFIFHDRTRGISKLGSAVMLAYLVQLGALYRARFPRLIGYIQFALIGLLGMAVDSVTFALAYWYLGFNTLGSTLGGFFAETLSFLIAARFNFSLNAAWTFRERRSHARLSVFIAVSLVGFVFRSILFEAILGLPPPQGQGIWATLVHFLTIEQIALIAGVITASLWNYWGSRRWAFPAGDEDTLEAFPRPSELVSKSWVVILLCTAGILRVLFSSITPLTFDETYYWQWSRYLAWGYFDHPPMIAYLIAAGTHLIGTSQLGVRLVPGLMGIASAWLIYRLTLTYWRDYRAALWAMVLAIVTPLFAIGGMIATPDTPLVFFWAATLLMTLYALEHQRFFNWLLVGVFAGLGLLSKLPMLILFLGIFMALLNTHRGRRTLLSYGPWLALIVAGSLATPMIIWEITNNFDSITFHLKQGLGPAGGAHKAATELVTFLQFMAGQVGIITPLLFLAVIGALVMALGAMLKRPVTAPSENGKLQTHEIRPFLVWPAVLTFLIFGGASFFANSGTNWVAPAYVTAFPLAGGLLAATVHYRRRWLRWLGIFAVGFSALLSLYVHVEVAHPLIAYRHYPLQFPWNHRPLARWVDHLQQTYTHDEEPPWIVASNYKLASELAFYIKGHPKTYDPFEKGSGSVYLALGHPPKPGTMGLYIADSRQPGNLHQLFVGSYRYLGGFPMDRLGYIGVTYYAFIGTLNPRVFIPPGSHPLKVIPRKQID